MHKIYLVQISKQRDNESTIAPGNPVILISDPAHSDNPIDYFGAVVTAYLSPHFHPHSFILPLFASCNYKFSSSSQLFMAITTKLSASAFLAILFANLLPLSSTTEPTEPIWLLRPGVLPYAAAPEASSFSPSPTAERPVSSAVQPEADSSAILAPSSGGFLGKKTSGSARLDPEASIFDILLCNLLATSLLVA